MKRGAVAWLVPLTLAAGGGASAGHHSLTPLYDTQRSIKISGTVAQFQFVNPHPILIVEIRGGDNEGETWRVELDNRGELASAGVERNTLKPGDRVVVTGNPGHTQPNIMYLRTLDRAADGFRLEQVNSGPRVRRRAPTFPAGRR
jgi:hypothetical protein